MTKEEFLDNIKNGICPFCGSMITFYDGALGYEAMECKKCKLTIDVYGIHLED